MSWTSRSCSKTSNLSQPCSRRKVRTASLLDAETTNCMGLECFGQRPESREELWATHELPYEILSCCHSSEAFWGLLCNFHQPCSYSWCRTAGGGVTDPGAGCAAAGGGEGSPSEDQPPAGQQEHETAQAAVEAAEDALHLLCHSRACTGTAGGHPRLRPGELSGRPLLLTPVQLAGGVSQQAWQAVHSSLSTVCTSDFSYTLSALKSKSKAY